MLEIRSTNIIEDYMLVLVHTAYLDYLLLKQHQEKRKFKKITGSHGKGVHLHQHYFKTSSLA